MKGTIISGEDVLKRISKGEWDAVKKYLCHLFCRKSRYYTYCQSCIGSHYK